MTTNTYTTTRSVDMRPSERYELYREFLADHSSDDGVHVDYRRYKLFENEIRYYVEYRGVEVGWVVKHDDGSWNAYERRFDGLTADRVSIARRRYEAAEDLIAEALRR